VGLPPEQFPLDIFTTVLLGLTVRGSIVGTRKDMTEAMDLFARGKVDPTFTTRPLGDINAIFGEMEDGEINGRVVMDVS
jgi:propanol-preferring alcohol dehydrogenase